jgi:hypothetical protein
MLIATFTFQSKGFGSQEDELLVWERHAFLDECTVDQMLTWAVEALTAGLHTPAIVRVDVGEPGETPELRFDNVRDFLEWQQRRRNHANEGNGN